MAKGGAYERELCVTLSLWVSKGKRDDLFWRSSQSGGRATTRAKRGKYTTGHCGDICATDSAGEWLTKLVTIEAKRGENLKAFMADLLDRDEWPGNPKLRKRTMLGMLEQARAAAKRARTPYWMLIHRRDKREALVYMPRRFYVVCDLLDYDGPHARFWFGNLETSIMVMRLASFLQEVDPIHLKKIKP